MRSSARLSIEKQPAGAGDTSGSQAAQVCVASVLASGTHPAASTRWCSRRPTLDGRLRSVRIPSWTSAATPSSPTSMVNVDQSVSISEMRPPGRTTRTISATAAAGSASHWSVRSERAASKDPVGSPERLRVTEDEAHPTTPASGVGTGDAQHLLRRVDADDLPDVAEVLRERERCLPEAAANVEQPFTMSEVEVHSLPRAESEGRVPLGSPIHGCEEHVNVRIVVDLPIPELVPVPCRHVASVRAAVVWLAAGPDGRRGDAIGQSPATPVRRHGNVAASGPRGERLTRCWRPRAVGWAVGTGTVPGTRQRSRTASFGRTRDEWRARTAVGGTLGA